MTKNKTITATKTMTNAILETCDIWDTGYNSDNWEPQFMTIFVTWQLRVTLDSIRKLFVIDTYQNMPISLLPSSNTIWPLSANFCREMNPEVCQETFLAVTWQLYRFPCHSLTHCHCWKTLLRALWPLRHSIRVTRRHGLSKEKTRYGLHCILQW